MCLGEARKTTHSSSSTGADGVLPEANGQRVLPETDDAFLVYIRGTRGLEAQVWYEPMVTVTPEGKAKAAINPEYVTIVGDPIPLPPRKKAWTPDEAVAEVKAA